MHAEAPRRSFRHLRIAAVTDCIGYARRSSASARSVMAPPSSAKAARSRSPRRRRAGVDALKALYRRPDFDSVSEEQSLHARKGGAWKEALFRHAYLGHPAQSCASCHNPGLGWGDGLPVGVGHGMAQAGPALSEHRQCRMGRHLHVGRPVGHARRSGARPDPVSRRDEHAARQAHGAALLRPEYKPLFEAAFPGEEMKPADAPRRSRPTSGRWFPNARPSTPGSRRRKGDLRGSQARLCGFQHQGTVLVLPRGLELHQ